MRIDRFCDKCILYPETEAIRKVELLYDSGLCTIRFRDGTSSSFLHDWEAYHVAYYGLIFTRDGKTVFTGSWEKGVYALDTASGKIIWHYRCTRVGATFGRLMERAEKRRRPKAAPTMNLSFSRARGRLYGRLLVTFFLRCRRFDGKLDHTRNLLPMKTS